MRIGILGAGSVGGALGTAWARHGHEVFFGVRHPDSAEVHALLHRAGPRGRAESVVDAVRSAEALVNALPWPATRGVLEKLDLAGKVLLGLRQPAEAGSLRGGGRHHDFGR